MKSPYEDLDHILHFYLSVCVVPNSSHMHCEEPKEQANTGHLLAQCIWSSVLTARHTYSAVFMFHTHLKSGATSIS
jgi:hypothetical protein